MWQFDVHCQADISGDPTGNPLAASLVQNFNACLDMCASLNYYKTNITAKCLAVTYVVDYPAPANCWAHAGDDLIVATDDYQNKWSALLITG